MQKVDLLVENGYVVERGRRIDPGPDVLRIDARRHVVIPGLVSGHSRVTLDPLPGFNVPSDSGQDRHAREVARVAAHGEESVICAAFSGALRAVQAGTTCLVESHASPGFVPGATRRLREVLLTIGLRALVSYRVSGAEGEDALAAALESTREGAVYGGTEQLRFAVGAAHPNDVDDEVLGRLAEIIKTFETPFHCEVGTRAGEKGAVKRLEKAGLLGPSTVLRVGSAISDADAKKVRESGTHAVYVPTGDIDAGVRTPLGHIQGGALGTDAAAPDVLAQARLAWRLLNAADPKRENEATTPDTVLELVASGHRLASQIFGIPFGTLDEGCAADIVILDYLPAWPLNPATVAHHVVCGFDTARVRSVMVDGRWLLRDGAFGTLDADDLVLQLHRGALDFWQGFAGSPFPGWEPEPEEEEEEEEEEEIFDEDGRDDQGDDSEEGADSEDGDDDASDEDGDEGNEDDVSDDDVSDDEVDGDDVDGDDEEEDEEKIPDDPFGAGIF